MWDFTSDVVLSDITLYAIWNENILGAIGRKRLPQRVPNLAKLSARAKFAENLRKNFRPHRTQF